jgi:hypothetical protein
MTFGSDARDLTGLCRLPLLARPPQRLVRAGKLSVERNKFGAEGAGKPEITGIV